MADKLEKNFWKAGQTPLSATNLNLMSNAIVDNAKAIENLIQTVEVTGEGEVITGASVGANGTLTLTKGNLPTASKEQKGVVKLSKNFEINENGELDIPIIDMGTLSNKFDYNSLNSIYLTDEQIAKIQNSNNILLKCNEYMHNDLHKHVNMIRTGETYKLGELYEIQFASIKIGSNFDDGVFVANLNLSTKEFAYTTLRLWNNFLSDTNSNSIGLQYRGGTSYLSQKSINFRTINGQPIVGSGNVETSIKFINVKANNWISDTTYADYPYKATIKITGITSSMAAEIILNVTEAVSGNYAPICETFDGGVCIYSKVNTAITIPTILVVK